MELKGENSHVYSSLSSTISQCYWSESWITQRITRKDHFSIEDSLQIFCTDFEMVPVRESWLLTEIGLSISKWTLNTICPFQSYRCFDLNVSHSFSYIWYRFLHVYFHYGLWALQTLPYQALRWISFCFWIWALSPAYWFWWILIWYGL